MDLLCLLKLLMTVITANGRNDSASLSSDQFGIWTALIFSKGDLKLLIRRAVGTDFFDFETMIFLLLQQVQAESTDKIKERANLVRSMLGAKGRPSLELAPVHWNGLDLVSWPFHTLHVDTFNKSLSLRAPEIVSWRHAFLWMMIEWS